MLRPHLALQTVHLGPKDMNHYSSSSDHSNRNVQNPLQPRTSGYSSLHNALGTSRSPPPPPPPSLREQSTQHSYTSPTATEHPYRVAYPQEQQAHPHYTYPDNTPQSTYSPQMSQPHQSPYQTASLQRQHARPSRPLSPAPATSTENTWSGLPSPSRGSHHRSRHRERENVPTRANRSLANSSLQLDYGQIMTVYNDIMQAASQDPLPPQLSALATRMQTPAMTGLRLLDPSDLEQVRPPDKKTKLSPELSSQTSSSQSPSDALPGPSVILAQQRPRERPMQVCKGCDATSTPEWRRGPLGPRTLCNACGLVYAKIQVKRRNREAQGRLAREQGREDIYSGSDVESTESPSTE